MHLSGNQLAALIAATSFAAGLNVYATVAALGLLSRAGWIALPSSLNVLDSWWIIGIAGVMFLIEFVADKIPAFDLIWNALQTFVRVPVAALIAFAATHQLSPQLQLVSVLAASLIALAAHGGKTAVRAGVTPSPEPVSNIALSTGEDVLAIFLTWFAGAHPYWAIAVVAALLIVIAFAVHFVIRALRALFRGAERSLSRSNPAPHSF